MNRNNTNGNCINMEMNTIWPIGGDQEKET
jgi:hypothetical protein